MRFGIIIVYALLSAGVLYSAENQERGSNIEDVLKGLGTSVKNPWHASTPDKATRSITTLGNNTFTFSGTSGHERLLFNISTDTTWLSPLRLIAFLQNKEGWYYKTSKSYIVPYGKQVEIDLDFSPSSVDWQAVGHARGWDAHSARSIQTLGFKVFSEQPFEGNIQISNLRTVAAKQKPSNPRAEIVDLDAPSWVEQDALFEASMRLGKKAKNPFDFEELDIQCEILNPEGVSQFVGAFYYQEYNPKGTYGPTPVGQGKWCVRYRPPQAGIYRYRIFLHREGKQASKPVADGWFKVVKTAEPSTQTRTLGYSRNAESVFEEFQLHLDEKAKGWRPKFANTLARWDGKEFEQTNLPLPKTLWRPVLEWSSRWGQWTGLARYDLCLAWRFDRALAEAEANGLALPCALIDDEFFLEDGKYRWGINPLSATEGGVINGPGEFFNHEAARKLFLMRAKYMIARFGHSKAISNWCVASGMGASKVPQWHQLIGTELTKLAGLTELISIHPNAMPFVSTLVLGEFEPTKKGGWRRDLNDAYGTKLKRGSNLGELGGDALAVNFPTAPGPAPEPSPTAKKKDVESTAASDTIGYPHATIYRACDESYFSYDYLAFDVKMPISAKEYGRAQVIILDRDMLWYEALLEVPLRPGDWTRLMLPLASGDELIKPSGHSRPWTGWSRSRIKRVAIRIFPNELVKTYALIDHVRLHRSARPKKPLTAKLLLPLPKEVGKFQKHETRLKLSKEFENPFDATQIAIDGIYTHESGKKIIVPAFFYEPYRRNLVKKDVLENKKMVSREVERLDVDGAPEWRLRFAPLLVGEWNLQLRVAEGDKSSEFELGSFNCTPSTEAGFIRISDDGQYFEHSDGDMFFPIGPVVRSPSDSRDTKRDPSILDSVLAANYRGTYQFDEYLDAMQKSGCNWMRMWLCSWWCGLEWYRKWPGYGGTGVYNMANAYRLDHIVDEASKRGIYLQLCLQNHGQASSRIDHEWEYNPYNKFEPEAYPSRNLKDRELNHGKLPPNARPLRPNGWVKDSRSFFSDKKVRVAKKNLYRYLIARWGYSKNIFAWVLSSEVEFTGEYERVQYQRDDEDVKHKRWKPTDMGRASATTDFHRDLAQYFKQNDPYGHIVTSHFSHPIRGRGVWNLEEMEFVQSNAYTSFSRYGWFNAPLGPNKCGAVPITMQQYYSRWMAAYDKPVLIGEWGGHWMANSIEMLDAELHTGTWSSVMTPLAGTTGFWWWTHLHFRDRWSVFAAVSKFMSGEDRRGKNLKTIDVEVTSKEKLYSAALGNKESADIYICSKNMVTNLHGALLISDAVLILKNLNSGRYTIEIWDTKTGEVLRREMAVAVNGVVIYEFAEFNGDIALKVRRQIEERR